MRDSNARKTVCANVAGAAVGVCVAGIILLANQWRWWRQWHANNGGGSSVGNAATNKTKTTTTT
jgi:hypothetical protein